MLALKIPFTLKCCYCFHWWDRWSESEHMQCETEYSKKGERRKRRSDGEERGERRGEESERETCCSHCDRCTSKLEYEKWMNEKTVISNACNQVWQSLHVTHSSGTSLINVTEWRNHTFSLSLSLTLTLSPFQRTLPIAHWMTVAFLLSPIDPFTLCEHESGTKWIHYGKRDLQSYSSVTDTLSNASKCR